MSWQNHWGTVKATNAKAAALYYEVANVGKTIESSKKRVVWRLKVEEGREFEITLTHSLASGKKVLRVDSIVKYTSQSLSFGDWDYVFNLPGGHCVHIIIKPSVELNDMYDLIIDGVSFRRLPDRLDPGARSKNGGATSATSSSSNSRKSNSSNSTYAYSSGNYAGSNGGSGSRDSSFGPWECPRCTLVNEKPLAPICEACGGPKPNYISPEARIRAKTVAESRSPAPASSTTRPTSKSTATAPSSSSGEFFSSSFIATTPADVTTGFDAFAPAPRKKSDHDISSMLAGLDFTPAAPPVAEPVPVEASFGTSGGTSTVPAEGDSNSRTASGDLWESNIVDLNLRPEDKKLQSCSAKSYQTLEQARLQAPKEKVAVLPPPPPQMPVPMAAMPAVAPMGYYATPTQVPQAGYYNGVQPMYATATAPGYGMGSQPQQFGGAGYGSGVQAPGVYQFMTAAPTNTGVGVQKPPTMLSADPFATLS